MRTGRLAAAVVTAAALTASWIPAAHATGDPAADATAALNAAIEASNEAYASGVVSDVRGMFPFSSDTPPVVTEYTSGVTGTDLFGSDPSVATAWMSDSKGVAVSVVATSDTAYALAERPDLFFASLANVGPALPKRVVDIVREAITAQGGTMSSLVKRDQVSADDWNLFYRDVFTTPANPAQAIRLVLGNMSDTSVTSSTDPEGGTTFTIEATSSSNPDAGLSTFTAHADAAGLITRVDWGGTGGGWVEVVAYGDNVVVPPAAADQISTPVLRRALDYYSEMFVFRNSMSVVRNELKAYAARGKVSKNSIRKVLLNAGIGTADLTERRSDFKVESTSNGYQISKVLSKSERAFGPLCVKVTAGASSYKYRACR